MFNRRLDCRQNHDRVKLTRFVPVRFPHWKDNAMRPALLVASLFMTATVVTPSLAATKTKSINHAAPTWTQCFQISLDRGMDHEYEEWRGFIEDCMAGKIPLTATRVTR